MGVEFSSFDNNRPFSRRRYKIGLFFSMDNQTEVTGLDRSVSVPMTLSDLERWDASLFSGWAVCACVFVLFDHCDQQRSPFDLRWPNLTCSGERVSIGAEPDLIPRERGYSTSKFYRVSFSNTVSPTTINFGVLTHMEWDVSRGTDMISLQEAEIEHSRFFKGNCLCPDRWSRRTEFGMVTRAERGAFLRGQPRSKTRRRGTIAPNFGTLYIPPHGTEQFLHGGQTKREESS